MVYCKIRNLQKLVDLNDLEAVYLRASGHLDHLN